MEIRIRCQQLCLVVGIFLFGKNTSTQVRLTEESWLLPKYKVAQAEKAPAGVDVSYWKNVKSSASFFVWDLQEDFKGAYHHGTITGTGLGNKGLNNLGKAKEDLTKAIELSVSNILANNESH